MEKDFFKINVKANTETENLTTTYSFSTLWFNFENEIELKKIIDKFVKRVMKVVKKIIKRKESKKNEESN